MALSMLVLNGPSGFGAFGDYQYPTGPFVSQLQKDMIAAAQNAGIRTEIDTKGSVGLRELALLIELIDHYGFNVAGIRDPIAMADAALASRQDNQPTDDSYQAKAEQGAWAIAQQLNGGKYITVSVIVAALLYALPGAVLDPVRDATDPVLRFIADNAAVIDAVMKQFTAGPPRPLTMDQVLGPVGPGLFKPVAKPTPAGTYPEGTIYTTDPKLPGVFRVAVPTQPGAKFPYAEIASRPSSQGVPSVAAPVAPPGPPRVTTGQQSRNAGPLTISGGSGTISLMGLGLGADAAVAASLTTVSDFLKKTGQSGSIFSNPLFWVVAGVGTAAVVGGGVWYARRRRAS
jgi:hypothetical protein